MVEQKNGNNNTAIKVQIEGLKKDIENVTNLNSRIDSAIEKLTDVSTDIKQMLAVHEEKISRQEQIDDIIFDKLKEKAGEIDNIIYLFLSGDFFFMYSQHLFNVS